MTQGSKDLIKYKLERSDETLEEAKIMLRSSHLFGAANRIYYACFYAVSALLLSEDLSSHKHSGVLSLFNRHFVKTGLIPVELGKFYSRLFDTRTESDYADLITIDLKEIKDNLKTAEIFIPAVKSLIKE
jgi:uncharacterized protein (UPF0332 family)